MHHELFEFDEAQDIFLRCLKMAPDHPATNANYALLLNTINEHEKSSELFEKALEKEPSYTLHRWDYALNLLDAGQWEKGWKEYEVRLTHISKDYPRYKFPMWQGEDLTNKTIIVYEEQGLGDRILFSRFLYQLKEKYPTCRIYYMCCHVLMPLLWEYQKAGIVEFLPIGCVFPEADYGIYLMSLPGLLGCNDPLNVPLDPGFIKQRCEFQEKVIELKTLILIRQLLFMKNKGLEIEFFLVDFFINLKKNIRHVVSIICVVMF